MTRRFGFAVVALAVAATIAIASSTSRTAEAGQQPAFPQAFGWARVADAVLSLFDNYDVVTLGEAHGRKVDEALRLHLIQHPGFTRRVRVIVTERGDEAFAAAVDAVNRTRPEAERIRVVPGGAEPVKVIVDQLGAGAKVLVVYGAGHLWKRQGEITQGLRDRGRRVSVVQTLAPPIPNATLTAFDAFIHRPDRPVLFSLRGTAIGRTLARQVYPGEPLDAALTLADLADVAVLFPAGPIDRTPD